MESATPFLLYGPLDFAFQILCALGLAVIAVIGLALWRAGKLWEAIQIAAGVLAIGFVINLGSEIWYDWQRKQTRQPHPAQQEQYRIKALADLVGNYFLADTMLLMTNYDSFADTLQPAPVHARLLLRPDSTYAYHSTIPTDVTRDTAGTWSLKGYSFNEELNREQFSVAFTPAHNPRCGLRIVCYSGRNPTCEGAYLHDNSRTRFFLVKRETR